MVHGSFFPLSKWQVACRCAVSDGVPWRSLHVALVVGTILNLINQGDVILSMASVNWFKVILTYLVPYAVCTYGAVSAQMRSAASGHPEELSHVARN